MFRGRVSGKRPLVLNFVSVTLVKLRFYPLVPPISFSLCTRLNTKLFY